MSGAVPTRFDDLRDAAREAGWSDELWDQISYVRPDRGAVEQWIEQRFPPPEGLADFAATEARFMGTALQRRIAVWADNDLLADIYANAPETVGEWQVTVEHEPYAFSQLRLQEVGVTMVIEEERRGQAAISRSTRDVVVGDDEITVMAISGMRVHREHQGKGLSNALLFCPGLSTVPLAGVGYWYARRDNSSAPWLAAVVENMEEQQPEGFNQETASLSATIFHLEVDGRSGDGARVRVATRDDLATCASLINRVNDGLDLWTPASEWSLRRRINHWGLGELPDFFDPVYGPDDFLVVEDEGRVVACGGYWDRGANMRERWVQSATGEERILEAGALLDYGYADGHADAMVELLDRMVHRAGERGRTSLMLPVEHDHVLLRELASRGLRPETRDLMVMPFAFPGMPPIQIDVRRPATDLAYW